MPVEKSKPEARCKQGSGSGGPSVASGKKRKKKKKAEDSAAAARGAKFAQGDEKEADCSTVKRREQQHPSNCDSLV